MGLGSLAVASIAVVSSPAIEKHLAQLADFESSQSSAHTHYSAFVNLRLA
jgi:hypothetical protein